MIGEKQYMDNGFRHTALKLIAYGLGFSGKLAPKRIFKFELDRLIDLATKQKSADIAGDGFYSEIEKHRRTGYRNTNRVETAFQTPGINNSLSLPTNIVPARFRLIDSVHGKSKTDMGAYTWSFETHKVM